MRTIEYIVIHCSATAASEDIGAAEIRALHAGDKNTKVMWGGNMINCKGWADIGYHFVIRQNGCTEMGRAVEAVGAHVYGYNAKSIGICLVGGARGEFNYTRHQLDQLKALVVRLKTAFPGALVVGHHDLDSGKSCPNFDAMLWWDEPAWLDEDYVPPDTGGFAA